MCCACHAVTFPHRKLSALEMDRLSKPIQLQKGNAITQCDTCNVSIQVHVSLAREHNLVKRLRESGIDAEMVWSAGSESICSVNRREGHYFVTYKFDCDQYYRIGAYDRDGAMEEEMEEKEVTTESEDEVVAFLMSRDDVARLIELGTMKVDFDNGYLIGKSFVIDKVKNIIELVCDFYEADQHKEVILLSFAYDSSSTIYESLLAAIESGEYEVW